MCRVSVVEALAMEPQARILLEQALCAFVDASDLTGSLLDTKTGAGGPACTARSLCLQKPDRRLPVAGVYVGCMYSEYTQLQHILGLQVSPSMVTSNGLTYLVGRVSYSFGLQGAIRMEHHQ